MKDFYLILFHISIVFSVITASNSFEVLGAVTSTETTIHSSAVLPPPPPAAPTVSLGVSPTGTVCAATALNFTATGSPTTGTNTYEFLVNGSVVQGPGISNTYSSSSLTNGQQVTTRLTNKPTFDGVINEALWDTPLSTSAGGAAPGFGAGHEVNALYSFGTANDFYLAVAGNVQNGNRILVFIDSKSGGYADGNFGRAGAPQGVDDFNSSTTFDSGFLPDYCLTMGTNGSNYFWDLYTLSGTAGSGGGPNTYLGDNSAAAVGGVDLKASPANSSQTQGFEAGLPKSLIGYTGGIIKVMVMYTSDAGFLSNQFLTPAGSGEGNYGSGAVTFGAAAPGPIVVSSTALSTVNTATSTPIIASVSLLPTITVSSNSPTCEGSTLSLLATGGSTYSWAGPNGFTSAVQNPSIISVTPAATGTYTVTVTNSAGCSTVGTTAVTINATPTADAGLPQTVCQGGTITLGGSLGGSAAISTWSAPSGAFSDATSLTSTYTPSITSGTVTLTFTTDDPDGAGPCSAAVSTVVITVGQAPVVNAGAPQSVCAGQSITLNGSTTGVPATPVTWSAPSGTFSNVNLLTSTYTPSITSGTVTLTLTTSDPDGAGPCVAATSTVVITVMASPTVAAGSNTPVCGGNPLSLTSSGGILYSWSGPSGFSSTSQNPSISAVTAANAGDYTVTVTNSNACSATGSTTVVINGAFSASASSNSPVNQGNPINLNTPTSGSSYAWSGPNGFTSSDQDPTVTATPEASGVYTVVVTNASGCTAMATTLVTVNLSQTSLTICSDRTATITAAVSGGTGSGCSITWETSSDGINGWTAITTGISGTIGEIYTTPVLNNVTSGQTFVYYRATYTCTGIGCGSSISNTQQIIINPEPVGSDPSVAPICSGTALNVGLQSTISNLPTGVTFSWSATDNADVTGETTTTSAASSITDNLVNISGTSQTVIYTVTPTSVDGCIGNPYTITVTVNPAPIFDVIANAAYCNNDAATAINFNTNVSGATITWTSTVNVGFGTSGNGNIPAYTATNTGTTPVTTTVTVTATGVGSCVTTTTFTVTVNPTPAVNTVSTPETCNELNNGTASITPIVGTAPFNYQWSNGDVTAIITGLAEGTYTATVTDANGCSTITSTSVTQPDVLTATASGVNETCNQLNNASVSVVAAGGTTAYSYAWNSGQTTASVSNATAGTYTVTVTDANGCTVSTSTIVTQPDALTATLESTVNVSCSTITPDGAINIATTGGTTAYTYAWTGTAATTEDLTGLAAGNYTLTVTDANGCSTVVGPITITLNPDPTITVGNSTTICTGGVANFTANVANGVGTCGVQWEQLIGATWTPISGANATTYTTVPLTATTDYRAVYSCSTGCTVTSSPVTATVTADPAISIASDATVCTGGTSVLTATPSGGTDSCIIQWQSSIDNSNWTNIPGANAATYTTPTLTTTTYYRALYTCNGNGCDGATSGSVTITVTATPVIIINAVPNGN